MTLFENCLRNFDPSKNMAAVGGGGGGDFLQCLDFREILQNSPPLKLRVRFWNNFTGLFLGDPVQKLFVKFWSVEKHGRCGGGLFAFYGLKEILKIFLLRNCWSEFGIILQNCSLDDPRQKCLQNFDPSINMAVVNGGFLHYTDIKKFLTIFFSETNGQILK